VTKASDVMKVPSDIPVEFAANVHSALTALRLLEDAGLKAGDFLVQVSWLVTRTRLEEA
jgi:hypothetical protein